jgi:hypothetical protein
MSFSLALIPEETYILQEEGIIGIEILGKRKVSVALLSLPSSPPNSASASSTSSCSTSVRLRSFNPSTKASLDLPTDIEGVAALEHLGFTRKVAEDVFERYAKRPNPQQNPDGIPEYAFGELNRLKAQPSLQDIPPRQVMNTLGISNELQDALLNPRFTQLFESQTLLYWLKDSMRMRFKTLEQLLERLKSHASRTITIRKGGKKRAKVEGLFEPGESSSSSQQPAIPPPTALANIRTTSEEHGLPLTWVSVEAAPPKPEGYVALYKGKSPIELVGGEGFIQDDGAINMNSIRTESGGDFNHINYAWYWTEERETAEEYRQWAASRSSWSETWLIRVLVPQTYLTGLRKQPLFFSPDWKEYVWYCKKQIAPPAKFDRFWKAGEAEVIEGHICGCAMQIIQRTKKEQVQQKISEDHCLVIGGKKAVQWVLMHAETAERFGEIAKGNVYIDVHPPTTPAK